jgi:hypothetical protein
MLKVLRRVKDRRRQAGGDYGWLFLPYMGDEVVAINVQTTGLDARHADLVSNSAGSCRDHGADVSATDTGCHVGIRERWQHRGKAGWVVSYRPYLQMHWQRYPHAGCSISYASRH